MPKAMKELKQLTKIIHPKSRKSAAIFKKMKKVSAREKSKLVHHMKQNVIGEKLLWFRDNLYPEVVQYTPELLLKLIEKYHKRFDEELEQIQLKHGIGQRKNRQHASREDIIKLTQLQEKEEFDTCGIELPDLPSNTELERLQQWNGELRFLQNFKLVRFTRKKLCNNEEHVDNKDEIVDEPMDSNCD